MECECGFCMPEIGLARVLRPRMTMVITPLPDPDYIVLIKCLCGKFYALIQDEASHEAGAQFESIPAHWVTLANPLEGAHHS